ncbi:hypothetical protein GBA52_004687 [Prunus armeniaca]|nr:hypothetical protein GBA52_004687 [Prunus armeniaca]
MASSSSTVVLSTLFSSHPHQTLNPNKNKSPFSSHTNRPFSSLPHPQSFNLCETYTTPSLSHPP